MQYLQHLLLSHMEPTLPESFAYLSTVYHSSRLVACSPITLYNNDCPLPCLVFAKTSSLDFYHLLNSAPVYAFTVELNYQVTSMLVIPSRHKRPDCLFISREHNQFTIYRPDQNNQLNVLLKRTYDFASALQTHTKIQPIYGLQYRFNSNDTQGYLYYKYGREIMLIKFAEKLEGFRETGSSTETLEREIVCITSIPRSKSRFKKDTLGVVFEDQGEHTFEVADLQMKPYDCNLSLRRQKGIIYQVYAGSELVVVIPFQVLLYNYDHGRLLATYKQPSINSIQRVLQLEHVYCGVGSQLVIFGKNGITHYGEFSALNAIHIGGNQMVTYHSAQNTRMIELGQDRINTIREWVNLGQVAQISLLDIAGTEAYAINSPNRTRPITVVTPAIGFTTLATTNLSSVVKSLLTLEDEGSKYILVSQYYSDTLILKVGSDMFQQVGQTTLQPLATYRNYLVTKEGLHICSNGKIDLVMEFKKAVSKAVVSPLGLFVLETAGQIHHFSLGNAVQTIPLDNQLSALTVDSNSNIYFCKWRSRKLIIVTPTNQSKIKLLRQAKALIVKSDYIYIGYSEGQVEVYSLVTLQKAGVFRCGATPIRAFSDSGSSVFAFSDRSSSIHQYRKGIFSMKDVMLKDVSGFLEMGNTCVVTCNKSLQLMTLDLSQKVNVRELDIPKGDIKIKALGNQLYVLTPFKIHVIDYRDFSSKAYSHQFSSVKARMERMGDCLLIAGKVSTDYAIGLFRNGEQTSRLNLKKAVYSIKSFGDCAVLGLDGELKFIQIKDGKVVELFSVSLDIVPYQIDVLPEHNKLVVVDTVKNLLLCSYNIQKRSVLALSRFGMANLSLEVSFLGDYVVETDSTNNIFLLSGKLSAENYLQRVNMGFNGGINISESVWTLDRAQDRQSLVYATSSGSIGKISLIKRQDYNKLSELQTILMNNKDKEMPYRASRDIRVLGRKVKMDHNSLVNGDLVKEILGFSTEAVIRLFGPTGTQLQFSDLVQVIRRVDQLV